MKARALIYIGLPVVVALVLAFVLHRPPSPVPEEPDLSRAIKSNQESFISQPPTEIEYELAESERRKAEEMYQLKHPQESVDQDFGAAAEQKRLLQLKRQEKEKAKARDNDVENLPWFNGSP